MNKFINFHYLLGIEEKRQNPEILVHIFKERNISKEFEYLMIIQ